MSVAIEITDLWKGFPMNRDRPGFKESLLRLPRLLFAGRKHRYWALQGVDLTIRQGERVGIIGKNGAGKSTLLSIMLGAVKPTRGAIDVHQLPTPMLGLGAGFNRELTGRENIYLNAILLGLTHRQVKERFDDIVEFSELAEFIDMPIRTYSNGMLVRLGFSIALHIDPQLLLLDEVLQVGDEGFRKKSGDAMRNRLSEDVTAVIVSHSLQLIRDLCQRVIWLHKGRIKADGAPGDVLGQYKRFSESLSVSLKRETQA